VASTEQRFFYAHVRRGAALKGLGLWGVKRTSAAVYGDQQVLKKQIQPYCTVVDGVDFPAKYVVLGNPPLGDRFTLAGGQPKQRLAARAQIRSTAHAGISPSVGRSNGGKSRTLPVSACPFRVGAIGVPWASLVLPHSILTHRSIRIMRPFRSRAKAPPVASAIVLPEPEPGPPDDSDRAEGLPDEAPPSRRGNMSRRAATSRTHAPPGNAAIRSKILADIMSPQPTASRSQRSCKVCSRRRSLAVGESLELMQACPTKPDLARVLSLSGARNRNASTSSRRETAPTRARRRF